MNRPRILIICPFYSPNLGGVESHLSLLTEYLIKRHFYVTVLTYKPLTTKVSGYDSYEKHAYLEIRRFWWFGYRWFDKLTPVPLAQFFYIVPGLLLFSFIWMFKNSKQVDVIHAHGFAAAFVARILNLFYPKRLIASTHFIYRRLNVGSLYGKFFKWVFVVFDKILLISKKSGKELKALGLNEKKMIVFHHWMDLSKIKPRNKIASHSKLVILFVGRIIRMKGVFELLEATKQVPSDVKIIVVGDGPDYEKLHEKSLGVKNFLMVGAKSHKEVFYYLNACDLLILPSLAEEAQPMIIMEALAAGRPVVVTNKGSAGEMVDSSVSRIICPGQNQIKDTILDFYYHPQKLRELTLNTRSYARNHFGIKNGAIISETYYEKY